MLTLSEMEHIPNVVLLVLKSVGIAGLSFLVGIGLFNYLRRRREHALKFNKKAKIHFRSWLASNLFYYNIFVVFFLFGFLFLEFDFNYVMWGFGALVAVISGYHALQKKSSPNKRTIIAAFVGSSTFLLAFGPFAVMEPLFDPFWHPLNLAWLLMWHFLLLGVYFLFGILSVILFFIRLWWISGHKLSH